MKLNRKGLAACSAALLMLSCTTGDEPVLEGPDPKSPVGAGHFDVISIGGGTGQISGKVWADANADGIQDGGELPLGGITVTLADCNKVAVASVLTAADGTYGFTDVPPAEYVLLFERLDGFSFTLYRRGGDPCADSDVFSDGSTICLINEPGEVDNCWDAGEFEGSPKKGTGCRVTGGGVDEFGNWDGTFENGRSSQNRYQFGGQAGANTALPPQPAGEWQHHQQTGPDGSFSFHGGTSSAPDGTEIDRIVCSDPGYCNPARPAPTKQIDFWGVGIFHNMKNPSAPLAANVVVGESLHWFEVNIDDAGEPGKGKGVPGNCPDDGFGLHGSAPSVDCSCADFYRITIHATTDSASPVIYQVWGYINGGNLQIHPLTGFDSR